MTGQAPGDEGMGRGRNADGPAERRSTWAPVLDGVATPISGAPVPRGVASPTGVPADGAEAAPATVAAAPPAPGTAPAAPPAPGPLTFTPAPRPVPAWTAPVAAAPAPFVAVPVGEASPAPATPGPASMRHGLPLGGTSPAPAGLSPWAATAVAEPLRQSAPVTPSWTLQGPQRRQPPPASQWAWPPPPPPPTRMSPPWTSPEPPRSRSRAPIAVAAIALLLVSGGTGAVVARLTAKNNSTPIIQAAASPAGTGTTGSGGGAASSGGPSGGIASNPAISGGASTGGAASIADVPKVLDPAIVDITNTLADGSGVAAGTGMVVTSNGEVLTNNHVISGAGTLTVLIGGVGSPHDATVVGYDAIDDIALVQIKGVSGLTTITAGDSSAVKVSQPVVALGNALGKQGPPAVAPGIITGLDQQITASDEQGNQETLTGLIQTNANIQPGDSGGALADGTGRVIGMNTAATVGRSRFNIKTTANAYAIPINKALSVVKQIENGDFTGNVSAGTRPIIGVQVAGRPAATATPGAQVVGVQSGSPAEAAGLKAGDTIVGVEGSPVASSTELGTAIQKHKVGDTIKVEWVDSAGTHHTATIKLAAGPPA